MMNYFFLGLFVAILTLIISETERFKMLNPVLSRDLKSPKKRAIFALAIIMTWPLALICLLIERKL